MTLWHDGHWMTLHNDMTNDDILNKMTWMTFINWNKWQCKNVLMDIMKKIDMTNNIKSDNEIEYKTEWQMKI